MKTADKLPSCWINEQINRSLGRIHCLFVQSSIFVLFHLKKIKTRKLKQPGAIFTVYHLRKHRSSNYNNLGGYRKIDRKSVTTETLKKGMKRVLEDEAAVTVCYFEPQRDEQGKNTAELAARGNVSWCEKLEEKHQKGDDNSALLPTSERAWISFVQ